MKPTLFDKLFLTALFAILLVYIFTGNSRYSLINHNLCVNIKAPNYDVTYDLYTDRIITVKGKISDVLIKIEKKKASIAAADCPNKTCSHSGEISNVDQILACIPNGVVVRITGDVKGGQIDSITK